MILLEVLNDPSRSWLRILDGGYDKALVAQIKARPGARWDPAERVWRVPVDAVPSILRVAADARLAKVVRKDTPPSMPPAPLTDSRLRPYQADGAAWAASMLSSEGAALIADDMGLGKSVQALLAMREAGADAPVIVCPAGVRAHWQGQARKWGVPIAFAHGYEQQVKSLRSDSAVRPAILDEGHYLKNPKAKRTQVIGDWIRACRAAGQPVLTLTGTPVDTEPKDIHNVLDLLWPGRFGRSFDFQRRYCGGGWVTIERLEKQVWQARGVSHGDELAERLRYVMLRRTKDQVAQDLPRLQRVMREVELPPAQAKRLAKAAHATAWTENSFDARVGEALTKTEEHKIDACLELTGECLASGQRPLIVCNRKATVTQLADSLGCPSVTGDVPADKRRAVLTSGQGPGVATWQSITTGIDLTEFDVMIFVGLWYVPSALRQVEARLHRIGQTRPVTIYYLIGIGTIDELVRETVIERLDMQAELLGDSAEFVESMRGGSDDELIAQLIARVKGQYE